MDYFGDEDIIGITGKVVSPVLALCVLIYMQECSRCIAEDDKMRYGPTKNPVEATHTMKHHAGRKRSTGPIYSTIAEQGPPPKKPRVLENGPACGHDLAGVVMGPPPKKNRVLENGPACGHDLAGVVISPPTEHTCRCVACADIGDSPPDQLLEQPPQSPTPTPHLLVHDVDDETEDVENETVDEEEEEEEEDDDDDDEDDDDDDGADADTVIFDPLWLEQHLEEIRNLTQTEIDEYLHKQAVDLLKSSESELKQVAENYYALTAHRAHQKMDKVLVHTNEKLENILELEKQLSRRNEELDKLLEIEEEEFGGGPHPLDEHELNKFTEEDDNETAEKNGSS